MKDKIFRRGASESIRRVGIGESDNVTRPRTLWPKRVENIFSKVRKVSMKRNAAEQWKSSKKGR